MYHTVEVNASTFHGRTALSSANRRPRGSPRRTLHAARFSTSGAAPTPTTTAANPSRRLCGRSGSRQGAEPARSAWSAEGGQREARPAPSTGGGVLSRSEEHTSELQSRRDLVCRLLLEKKKK